MDPLLFKSGMYRSNGIPGLQDKSPGLSGKGIIKDLTIMETLDRSYSIGMFDDVLKAAHAVSDVEFAGIDKHDIMLVVSDDDKGAESLMPHDVTVVHPTSDTQRGYMGGAAGAAAGGLIGGLVMFALNTPLPGGAITYPVFAIGGFCGLLCGGLIGAATARMLPQCKPLLPLPMGARLPDLGTIGGGYDRARSAIGGAIGGGMGAAVGVMAAYLMGIPSLGFFLSAGFWAGAVSLIVGGLIGGMSGRGLEARSVGVYENLVDSSNSILVSVNCLNTKRPEIERLMLSDGAKMVRIA